MVATLQGFWSGFSLHLYLELMLAIKPMSILRARQGLLNTKQQPPPSFDLAASGREGSVLTLFDSNLGSSAWSVAELQPCPPKRRFKKSFAYTRSTIQLEVVQIPHGSPLKQLGVSGDMGSSHMYFGLCHSGHSTPTGSVSSGCRALTGSSIVGMFPSPACGMPVVELGASCMPHT